MHIFPQLRKLEEKYADELTLVGVHSAKFPSEKETENIRKAVLRNEIEHPVVNDAEFMVWQQYSVRAWPTLMFIDPEGKVIGKHEGEITLDAFDKALSDMIAEYDEQSLLTRTPLRFKLEKEKELERPLSFPGKVLADAASGRLFIADSNHNRIVVSSLDGDVQHVVGSGVKGFKDGDFGEAQFNDPQGIALDGNALYVADTGNHAIRRIDFSDKSVENMAGTGEQARSYHGGGNGLFAPLNSPWDVEVNNGIVYIAMAGFHQLWSLDPVTNEVQPHAGNGRERIIDGPLLKAELAQPSGIVTDGEKLYFTDSESSAIRTADIKVTGEVKTLVGMHLFEFGDIDGVGDAVRLQHPLGIDILDGVLYITDTYNNKIKQIFPDTREARSYLGTGEPGLRDGTGDQATFHEPGGLSIAGGKMYIADTNNHAIRIVDLASKEVITLELKGI
jgi:DNA-binding beta-propeller fold protein YncE